MRTIACVILALALMAAPAAQEPFDLDVLLDRLTTYLQAYESELSLVVADEKYVQEERRGPVASRTRSTESEVLFLRVAGVAEWLGVRDVRKVNGKPVIGTGVRLSELLQNPGVDLVEKAAAIVDASAEYNLGGRRTINMPTVPLQALAPDHHPRYIFKVEGKARVGDTATVRLTFDEFDEPTLVQSTEGANLWSRGTAWVDPATGALWRAELIVGPDKPGTYRRVGLEARIRVEFARDPGLRILVPKELSETFWIRGGRGAGTGKYANYRRLAMPAR